MIAVKQSLTISWTVFWAGQAPSGMGFALCLSWSAQMKNQAHISSWDVHNSCHVIVTWFCHSECNFSSPVLYGLWTVTGADFVGVRQRWEALLLGAVNSHFFSCRCGRSGTKGCCCKQRAEKAWRNLLTGISAFHLLPKQEHISYQLQWLKSLDLSSV